MLKKVSKFVSILATSSLLLSGMFFAGCSSDDDDGGNEVTTYKCSGCGTEYATETEKNNCGKQEGCPKYVPEDQISGNLYPENGASSVFADTELIVKFDEVPVISENAEVKIYEGETVVDTIKAKDEKLVVRGEGAWVEINVKDQLMIISGNQLVIHPHTDSNGRPVLQNSKTYKVVVSGVTGKIDGAEYDGSAEWSFTTAAAPSIEGTSLSVGHSSDTNFYSIQGAFNYIMDKNDSETYTVNVAAGRYHERLSFTGTANVNLKGAISTAGTYGTDTVVYWKNNQAWNNGARTRTNFIWQGANLNLRNITFKSTYLRTVDGTSNNDSTETFYFDSKAFMSAYNCTFDGHQDTLILGNSGGRCWFYDCVIKGDVDYIWGYADVALIENCKLYCVNDDGKTPSYIFASRTPDTDEVNKGFVLLNSTIDIADGQTAYYGRNSNLDTIASVINCKFTASGTGTVKNTLWGSASTKQVKDILNDAAISYMDYNNTFNDTAIATNSRLANTFDMSERVVNREYNGRYVILNRGYNQTDKIYKTASKIWDISAIETEIGASADVSKKNVFVEPVYYPGLVKDATATFKVYDVSGNEVTDSTWTSDNAAATVANGVVTGAATEETLVKITATKGSASDYATVQSVAEVISATAIDFTAPTTLNLDDSIYITATLTPSSEGKSVTNRTVTWTATGGIKFKDDVNKKAVDTITTTVNAENQTVVGLYASSTTAGTIIGTVVEDDGVTKTSTSITISDAIKNIGAVPEAGYTFSFIKKDATVSDPVLNGTAKATSEIYHNIAYTADRSKVVTMLAWDKESTLTDTYFNIKCNGTKTNISYTAPTGDAATGGTVNVSSWDPAKTPYNALKLSGIKGSYKIIVNASDTSDRNKAGRAFVVRIQNGETKTDKMFEPLKGSSTAFETTYTATGDESTDVYIGSSNDVRIYSIILQTPNGADPSVVSADTFFDLRTMLSGCSTGGSPSTGSEGKVSYTSMYYKDTQHGAYFAATGTISFVVSGACTVYLAKNQHSAVTFTVSGKDAENNAIAADKFSTTEVDAKTGISGTIGSSVTTLDDDEQNPSFRYTGTTKATITISVTGEAGMNYLPAIQVKF